MKHQKPISSLHSKVSASVTDQVIESNYIPARGCLDIPVPHNAYSEKEEDRLIVKCHNSNRQWALKCIGTRWIGSFGNCTVPPSTLVSSHKANWLLFFSAPPIIDRDGDFQETEYEYGGDDVVKDDSLGKGQHNIHISVLLVLYCLYKEWSLE